MKDDDFIIIDGRIICLQEEWDKMKNYKGGIELTKSLMFGTEEKLRDIASTLNKNSFRGYYCEAENSCDKQCKKCKDEQQRDRIKKVRL